MESNLRGPITLGVDVGQRIDPTAIAVLEHEWRQRVEGFPEGDVHHIVRDLGRLPLGTPYPEVARRLAKVARGVKEYAVQQPWMYLDATGVGTPLVDVLKSAGVQARLIPVFFTHGDRRSIVDGEVRLGKAWLVSRLQSLLQGGLLHLPRTSEAEVLQDELLDYEVRVDENANDRYGAFKVGTHDDLVTALGLATQVDRVGGEPVAVSSPVPFKVPNELPFSVGSFEGW